MRGAALTLWFLPSAFPGGPSLLQTAPGSISWQRKRPVAVLAVRPAGPAAVQQRQQPNGQSVPAVPEHLGVGAPAAATPPGPPAEGPPAGPLAAWLLCSPSQPVTPAAPADAQRQPQWQRGGADHGEGGAEPLAVPQQARGGGETGPPAAQVRTLTSVRLRWWARRSDVLLVAWKRNKGDRVKMYRGFVNIYGDLVDRSLTTPPGNADVAAEHVR